MADYDQNIPIYLQIIAKIKQEILSGALKPSDRMPSLNDIAVKMEVNPNTMYRVYKELEFEGIIYTKRGLGSFVVDDDSLTLRLRKELSEELVSLTIKRFRAFQFSDKEMLNAISEGLKKEGV